MSTLWTFDHLFLLISELFLMLGVSKSPQPTAVKLAQVYSLLVEHPLSGEGWKTVLQQNYSFSVRSCSSSKDVHSFTAKWSQCGLQGLHYSQDLIGWRRDY